MIRAGAITTRSGRGTSARRTWTVCFTKAGGVSQVPEYLKLTEEIGEWGGDITKAQLPDFFEGDYVRVYEMSQ